MNEKLKRPEVRNAQTRSVVRILRNPGLWVVLVGLALILDMMLRTDFLAPGTRLRGWLEPGKQFARQFEGWIGLVCVAVGMWFYFSRPKSDPSE